MLRIFSCICFCLVMSNTVLAQHHTSGHSTGRGSNYSSARSSVSRNRSSRRGVGRNTARNRTYNNRSTTVGHGANHHVNTTWGSYLNKPSKFVSSPRKSKLLETILEPVSIDWDLRFRLMSRDRPWELKSYYAYMKKQQNKSQDNTGNRVYGPCIKHRNRSRPLWVSSSPPEVLEEIPKQHKQKKNKK